MTAAPRFYLISDRRRMGPDPLTPVLRLAAAGLPAFQWRERDLTPLDNYRFLQRLVSELREVGATTQVLVNDRIDTAMALGIGVQLPEEGLPTKVARSLLGPDAMIGRSTHSIETALRARDEGADFVTFSPIYDTASKRLFGRPQGLEMLGAVARQLAPFPVIALGGITARRAQECMKEEAAGVASIGAIWESEDPVRAYEEFTLALQAKPSG